MHEVVEIARCLVEIGACLQEMRIWGFLNLFSLII